MSGRDYPPEVGGWPEGAGVRHLENQRCSPAELEYEGFDYRVGVYFCLDGAKPTAAEQNAVFDLGNMPLLPRSLKITTVGVPDLEGLTARDDPGLSMFDGALYASASPAGSSWMTEEQGGWLLDRLP